MPGWRSRPGCRRSASSARGRAAAGGSPPGRTPAPAPPAAPRQVAAVALSGISSSLPPYRNSAGAWNCGAAASAASIRSTRPLTVSNRVSWMVSGSCDSRLIASRLSLAVTRATRAGHGEARHQVGEQPQAGAQEQVHLRPSPHRGRHQHVAVHRRRIGVGRQAHQHRRAHALAHQDQPARADSAGAAAAPSSRASSTSACVARPVATHRGVAEATLIGGEHGNAGGGEVRAPGYSQASRLSFMPCSASTTAQGSPVRQPGPIGQAHAVRHDESIVGRARRRLPGPAEPDAGAAAQRSATASSAVSSRWRMQAKRRLKAWGASLSYGPPPP